MSRIVDPLLLRLRDLRKAHDKLRRAVPDAKSAEAIADHALDQVIQALENPELASIIDELIAAARERVADAPDFDDELKSRREELIKIEANLMSLAGAAPKDIESLNKDFERNRDAREDFVPNVAAVGRILVCVHQAAKGSVAESRSLGRKGKKRRKRKVAQGITSAVFGAGAIAADTQLPVLFAFSYGLGGAALHQAMRDLVGE